MNFQMWLDAFINTLLSLDTITAESLDADITYAVDANFEKMAELHYANI